MKSLCYRILGAVMALMMLITCLPLSVAAAAIPEKESMGIAQLGAEILNEYNDPSVPQISGFSNTLTGTKISWKPISGAVKYRVYYINSNGSWQGLGNTSSTSFVHDNLTPYKTYTYTLRVLDSKGVAVSDYNKLGFKNTFYAVPEMQSLTNTAQGVKVKWNTTNGISSYRLYRRTNGSAWEILGDVNGTSYVDSSVSSGNKYTYTARCLDSNSKLVSFHNQGKSITFFEAPVITKTTNTAGGTTITWEKVNGASKYRVYFVNAQGVWQGLGNTTSTSYTHNNLTDGKTYIYTVRCMDSSGNAIGDYNRQGVANTYLAPPVITSLSNATEGVKIKWGATDGITSYRLYRKTNGGSWIHICDVNGTSYTDTTAISGNKYTYTTRCLNSKGALVSHHTQGSNITYYATPVITKVSNTATGTTITWDKVSGASKYRVYYINAQGVWQGLGNTTSTSYTHDKLTGGKTYTYTVRCLDKNNTAVSDYNRKGVSNTFYLPPVISSLSNTTEGVKVKWNSTSGISSYRLYRRTNGSAWEILGDVKGTTYVDTTATSGNKYTYTARCLDSNSKLVSFHNQGKSITFFESPVITKIENNDSGSVITWKAVNGATQYRVYYINAQGVWQGLGNTTTTTYRHTGLTEGKTYTYTVRCLDSKGTAVSDYNKQGTSTVFYQPPAITSVTKAQNGYLIKWQPKSGVPGYRLFRRTVGSSWEKLFSSTPNTSYTDTTAKFDTVYTYTLRYVDKNGNYLSGYINDTKYYYNGALANGTIRVNGVDCFFNNGLFRSGYQKIGGAEYYYGENGAIQKNGIVGSDKHGWRYADKNGKIDYTYCNGVTQNGIQWIVINGKAQKVVTESDKTLYRAAKEVAKVTKPTMTKQQKLKACFDYCKVAYDEYNPRIPHYKGMDWPIVYANDMFIGGGGNCLSYGAAFAYMAKAIGYTEVYGCHSGGHGWAEIDGLVYDPEWSKHRNYHTYFALSYDVVYDQNYKAAIAPGLPWMRVKI